MGQGVGTETQRRGHPGRRCNLGLERRTAGTGGRGRAQALRCGCGGEAGVTGGPGKRGGARAGRKRRVLGGRSGSGAASIGFGGRGRAWARFRQTLSKPLLRATRWASREHPGPARSCPVDNSGNRLSHVNACCTSGRPPVTRRQDAGRRKGGARQQKGPSGAWGAPAASPRVGADRRPPILSGSGSPGPAWAPRSPDEKASWIWTCWG